VAGLDNTADGLERKLATILSADVAAYSRLMAEDEELTLRTFRGHKEVFEKLVELHRGRVFNTAGDAILAEFGSAVEAVRCATEIQAALRTRNDQLPEDRQVRFRIGVNLGDVMVQGQDLLGDGVNVAARLQGAAEPGGVCIAGSVYDQIRNKLSLSFTSLGEMSYKNIPQPVRTFAIAEADGLGILPAPARQRRIGAGRLWAVAAIVLLLAAAGAGVWGYSDYRRSRAEAAHAAAVAAQKTAAEAAKAAQQQAADAARQKALAEQKRIDSEANRPAEANRKENEAPQLAAVTAPPRVAPPQPDLPPSAAALPKPASPGDPTGVYGGPICFGPGETDPARCFRAQAVVRNKTISGQWPGRTPGATVYLAGDVTRAGDVAIHMHTKRADGSRFAVIDLVGKLRDGRIDATGSFRNGRSVSLNWRKD
jgi:class 3 adenylate cyclase/type II secretory pathway pseudopilin PulG